MNITIASPNTIARSIPISSAMERHWNIPINHAQTILDQINNGMYARWFKGKKDLVCMDFGANVGLVSLYMMPACRQLFCIEPTSAHYDLMRELLFDNNGSCIVKCSDFALTGIDDEFQFATGHSTENKVTIAGGYGNNKIRVVGRTLNFFLNLANPPVDFCKIDIEGGEMMALTLEQIKLAKGKVKTFFVEVHPAFGGGMDENREELIQRFMKGGFAVEQIDYQTLVATG